MKGFFSLAAVGTVAARRSELVSDEEFVAMGFELDGNATEVSSHDGLPELSGGYPDAFTWCDKDGVNYCTSMLNQHIPQYCGSCWAHGSVSALQDRIKIARGGQSPDVELSVQHILNCNGGGSCHGGSLGGPYQWLYKKSKSGGPGLSYFTSNPYLACSHESKEGFCPSGDWSCSDVNVAKTCGTFGEECVGLNQYPSATISDHGTIRGTSAMQKEIFNRGPVACGIDAMPIVDYTGGIAKGFALLTDHVISVVGWGNDAEEGMYWIVRNSWGEYWGEQGFVNVKAGSLALNQCAWAVPGDYTVPEAGNDVHCFEDGSNCDSSKVSVSEELAEKVERPSEVLSRDEQEALGIEWMGNSSAPSSHEGLPIPNGVYPSEFTWCNKEGVSYCTSSLNQHIPQYCGSCWAHGSVSALQDRIKIARGGKGIDIKLSVQHVLNCGNAGSCHGGSGLGVYQWIKSISDATGSGISYLSGQPYVACSSESQEGLCPHADWTCTPKNVAISCGTFGQECIGLDHYPNATISEYGSISGADAMQKEIYNRGPISCEVDAGPLDEYTTGIVTATSDHTNHIISVVGWGNDATEGLYWIVRNSWGEYWGEHGYTRVKSGAINIESSCAWAVPDQFTSAETNSNFPCFEDGSNCETATEIFA